MRRRGRRELRNTGEEEGEDARKEGLRTHARHTPGFPGLHTPGVLSNTPGVLSNTPNVPTRPRPAFKPDARRSSQHAEPASPHSNTPLLQPAGARHAHDMTWYRGAQAPGTSPTKAAVA
ncbi:hypothetical protein T484DRAFT_1842550 [Baffinella frigidus]|nr:hypothetical protein T484DRAFT_1842550 [Cryptophyta sp. CCMP2293]